MPKNPSSTSLPPTAPVSAVSPTSPVRAADDLWDVAITVRSLHLDADDPGVVPETGRRGQQSLRYAEPPLRCYLQLAKQLQATNAAPFLDNAIVWENEVRFYGVSPGAELFLTLMRARLENKVGDRMLPYRYALAKVQLPKNAQAKKSTCFVPLVGDHKGSLRLSIALRQSRLDRSPMPPSRDDAESGSAEVQRAHLAWLHDKSVDARNPTIPPSKASSFPDSPTHSGSATPRSQSSEHVLAPEAVSRRLAEANASLLARERERRLHNPSGSVSGSGSDRSQSSIESWRRSIDVDPKATPAPPVNQTESAGMKRTNSLRRTGPRSLKWSDRELALLADMVQRQPPGEVTASEFRMLALDVDAKASSEKIHMLYSSFPSRNRMQIVRHLFSQIGDMDVKFGRLWQFVVEKYTDREKRPDDLDDAVLDEGQLSQMLDDVFSSFSYVDDDARKPKIQATVRSIKEFVHTDKAPAGSDVSERTDRPPKRTNWEKKPLALGKPTLFRVLQESKFQYLQQRLEFLMSAQMEEPVFVLPFCDKPLFWFPIALAPDCLVEKRERDEQSCCVM